MLFFDGERVIPWRSECGRLITCPHVRRYAWALDKVWGKKVIDLGCGTGYGTFMLSWVARRAVGIDASLEAIEFAAEHFKAENLTFAAMDIERRSSTGDVYVAFEVLEHLERPERLIEENQPLLWSMPIGDDSRFHKRPYTLLEIDQLTGGAQWLQDVEGNILPRLLFVGEPKYALGIRGALE